MNNKEKTIQNLKDIENMSNEKETPVGAWLRELNEKVKSIVDILNDTRFCDCFAILKDVKEEIKQSRDIIKLKTK